MPGALEGAQLDEQVVGGRPLYRWAGGLLGPGRDGRCTGQAPALTRAPGAAEKDAGLLFYVPRLGAWVVGVPGPSMEHGVPESIVLIAQHSARHKTPATIGGGWSEVIEGKRS